MHLLKQHIAVIIFDSAVLAAVTIGVSFCIFAVGL